jgi:hypothetical protein
MNKDLLGQCRRWQLTLAVSPSIVAQHTETADTLRGV